MSQPVRHRYLCDRIMLLLLYKPSEKGLLERRNGTVNVKVSWLAKQLKLNSSKLYDSFLFLQHTGYLKMDREAKWGYVRLLLAEPLKEDPWPEKSTLDYLAEASSKKNSEKKA